MDQALAFLVVEIHDRVIYVLENLFFAGLRRGMQLFADIAFKIADHADAHPAALVTGARTGFRFRTTEHLAFIRPVALAPTFDGIKGDFRVFDRRLSAEITKIKGKFIAVRAGRADFHIFVNALDDFFFRAFLKDVVVDAELQGNGTFGGVFPALHGADTEQVGVLNFQVPRGDLKFFLPEPLGVLGERITPPVVDLQCVAVAT